MKYRDLFEWDVRKSALNLARHGVSFERAMLAFKDTSRYIEKDEKHSRSEPRYYCYGVVDGGVLTVRFTPRGDKIRIIGAAYWRKGKKKYAEAGKKEKAEAE